MIRLIICLGLALAPQLGWASEWTFKTVTPPAADATNRINIQITPTIVAAPPGTAPIAAPVVPSAPTGNLQPWFWECNPTVAGPRAGGPVHRGYNSRDQRTQRIGHRGAVPPVVGQDRNRPWARVVDAIGGHPCVAGPLACCHRG